MKNKDSKTYKQTKFYSIFLIFVFLINARGSFVFAQESENLSTEVLTQEEVSTTTTVEVVEETPEPKKITEPSLISEPEPIPESEDTEEDLSAEILTQEETSTTTIIEVREEAPEVISPEPNTQPEPTTKTPTSTLETKMPEEKTIEDPFSETISSETLTQEEILKNLEPELTPKFIGAETKFFINQDDKISSSRVVSLTFMNQGQAKYMSISNTPEFENAIIEKFKKEKKWVLSPSNELKTVFVKFYDTNKDELSTEKDYIELLTTPPNSRQSKGDFDQNNKTNKLDYNVLQLNIGRTGYNSADTNNDGIIDIFDVFNLMVNWTK